MLWTHKRSQVPKLSVEELGFLTYGELFSTVLIFA